MKILRKIDFRRWFKYNNIIFLPLAFIAPVMYLLSPEKTPDATQTLITFDIFFYITFSLISYYLFESYNLICDIFKKTTPREKQEIINRIKNDNPTLSKTAIISLEHFINDTNKITSKDLSKKLNEINHYIKS